MYIVWMVLYAGRFKKFFKDITLVTGNIFIFIIVHVAPIPVAITRIYPDYPLECVR